MCLRWINRLVMRWLQLVKLQLVKQLQFDGHRNGNVAATSHQAVAAYTFPTTPRAIRSRPASTYILPLLGSVVGRGVGKRIFFYRVMASSPPLSRPRSLSEVRSSPDSSSRFSLIATLEPFRAMGGATGTTVPSASNYADSNREMFNSKPRKQRRVNAQKGFSGPLIQTLSGTFVPAYYEQFLVIESLGGVSVMELDIFDVHRALIKVCGREPKVSSQRDGSLLVEMSSPKKSVRFRAISSVPRTQVACTPHATLNQYKGVIFSRDIMRYSNEKLLHELSDHGVVGVDRLQKKVDRVLVPTPTLFLTFDRLKLPEVVKLSWLRLQVKPYILPPR